MSLVCEICDKVFTGECNRQQHFASEKHKKKVAQQTILSQSKAVFVEATPPGKDGASVFSRSRLCSASSDENKSCQKSDKIFSTGLVLNAFESQSYYCEVCDIHCTGPQPYEQHIHSNKHAKKARTKLLQSNVVSSVKENASSCKIPCDLCNVDFCSVASYRAHVNEPDHCQRKKQVEKMYSSSNLSSLRCEPCGKIFSGDIPLAAHLESKAHQKKMQMCGNLTCSAKSDSSSSTKGSNDDVEMDSDDEPSENEMQFVDCINHKVTIFDVGEKITFN